MIGKCESCGTSNIEVIPSKENGKEKLLCNQCRPADGAYGYWLTIINPKIIISSVLLNILLYIMYRIKYKIYPICLLLSIFVN